MITRKLNIKEENVVEEYDELWSEVDTTPRPKE